MKYSPRKTLYLIGVALLLVLSGLFPGMAAASMEQLEFKKLDVSVWPEYDDPRVLVILQGTFINTSDKPFNGLVTWNIPKDPKLEVGMACEIVDGGGHSCQPYKVVDKGEWKELAWRTTRDIAPGEEYPVFLEYYYNPINGTADKTFNFTFQPSYKIQAANLTVKQPLKATNFRLDPQPAGTNQDTNGFTDHNYVFSNIANDKKIAVKVSYTKSDPNPSVQKPTDSSAASSASNKSGQPETKSGLTGWLPGALTLIAGGIFIGYFFSRKKVQNAPVARIRRQFGGPGGVAITDGLKLAQEKIRLRKELDDGLITEEQFEEMIDKLNK